MPFYKWRFRAAKALPELTGTMSPQELAEALEYLITHENAGYFDVGPLDLGENARRDMVLTLEEMGYEVEASHHEAAPAQHEIDLHYDEALKTVTFGKRKGLFNGMLKQRKFNVVFVSKDSPKALDLENPEGVMVEYKGKAVSVKL